jgi:hypothetical protein
MAVTRTESGWVLTAAADAVTHPSGRRIVIDRIFVNKFGGNGEVTFKDGAGTNILTTGTLVGGTTVAFPMGAAEVTSLEMDAISAGSATAYVIGRVAGR